MQYLHAEAELRTALLSHPARTWTVSIAAHISAQQMFIELDSSKCVYWECSPTLAHLSALHVCTALPSILPGHVIVDQLLAKHV